MDKATVTKLVIFALALVFVGVLVALKDIPADSAMAAFSIIVSTLLGALGLKAAGQHIGDGLTSAAAASERSTDKIIAAGKDPK